MLATIGRNGRNVRILRNDRIYFGVLAVASAAFVAHFFVFIVPIAYFYVA